MSVMKPPVGRRAGVLPRWQPWVRAVIGAGILVAIVSVAGAEPFVRGIASVSPAAIAAATLLAAIATAAAAWRWRLLARRLGLRLGWRESIAAYYRSQFLNTVLPGGVVGDVDRAVSHGRGVDQVAQAARAVAAERASGQAVQLVLAVAVVVSVGFSAYAPGMAVLLVLCGAVVVVIVAAAVSRRTRLALGREVAILRGAFGSVGTVVGVVAASTVVVTAHVATFLVACAAVGIAASAEQVTVAAVVAVLASSIPLSLGGWGPREGAAAWAFGAAGLGAAAGLAAATAYGVLAMIAVAPGAVVVAVSLLHRRRVFAGAAGRAAS
ncbi:lysylphosphatidylglycerol synthase domain-containing protein [Microbacterium allomyrinae]|uniref:Flippase-like domain-containing protein n=1 Tax=Microbacterium allomyrinae TaxID=2830666 RepID=A0A9X1S2N4_9MICO|nr:lysylphosphatidylglycerol synthase domain-containing protein [Microbacterium allomyrinae]MCC2031078.1 flippase-like domain-containing protein [Microbacterium allomyrinae]